MHYSRSSKEAACEKCVLCSGSELLCTVSSSKCAHCFGSVEASREGLFVTAVLSLGKVGLIYRNIFLKWLLTVS